MSYYGFYEERGTTLILTLGTQRSQTPLGAPIALLDTSWADYLQSRSLGAFKTPLELVVPGRRWQFYHKQTVPKLPADWSIGVPFLFPDAGAICTVFRF